MTVYKFVHRNGQLIILMINDAIYLKFTGKRLVCEWILKAPSILYWVIKVYMHNTVDKYLNISFLKKCFHIILPMLNLICKLFNY